MLSSILSVLNILCHDLFFVMVTNVILDLEENLPIPTSLANKKFPTKGPCLVSLVAGQIRFWEAPPGPQEGSNKMFSVLYLL